MDFTEILKVILLGVVEGITEWLPISSTGHMILVDEFVKLNVSEAFREMFFVVIQLGAIFAVIVLYWSKLFPFKKQKIADAKARIVLDRETMLMWLKVIIAVLPAALIGIPFDDQIDAMFYNYQTVAVTLILYGVLFIVIETRNRGKLPRINSIENITYGTAIIIGIFQVLSLIPGTSRSGATIVGAILIGVSRTVAAEFTFFLAIPVMLGASLLKLVKFGLVFTQAEAVILAVGMITAFVVSILAIKFLMGYIKKHDFKVFGYYRIILGIAVVAYFMIAG
ncbi:MAG: undecaprenyl-diphosphate phosphatase [Proteocatella sp.]|nr:undecaprenyl-diphosphate phosphatase [Proteocatella sp.]MBP9658966.1 undecaprenyl-diphosphate phosphatase [Proteocatella sp.]MBP9966593.1 undecaprenyl-diphosphate phosphatase [Proteocatella sp.]